MWKRSISELITGLKKVQFPRESRQPGVGRGWAAGFPTYQTKFHRKDSDRLPKKRSCDMSWKFRNRVLGMIVGRDIGSCTRYGGV